MKTRMDLLFRTDTGLDDEDYLDMRFRGILSHAFICHPEISVGEFNNAVGQCVELAMKLLNHKVETVTGEFRAPGEDPVQYKAIKINGEVLSVEMSCPAASTVVYASSKLKRDIFIECYDALKEAIKSGGYIITGYTKDDTPLDTSFKREHTSYPFPGESIESSGDKFSYQDLKAAFEYGANSGHRHDGMTFSEWIKTLNR